MEEVGPVEKKLLNGSWCWKLVLNESEVATGSGVLDVLASFSRWLVTNVVRGGKEVAVVVKPLNEFNAGSPSTAPPSTTNLLESTSGEWLLATELSEAEVTASDDVESPSSPFTDLDCCLFSRFRSLVVVVDGGYADGDVDVVSCSLPVDGKNPLSSRRNLSSNALSLSVSLSSLRSARSDSAVGRMVVGAGGGGGAAAAAGSA